MVWGVLFYVTEQLENHFLKPIADSKYEFLRIKTSLESLQATLQRLRRRNSELVISLVYSM